MILFDISDSFQKEHECSRDPGVQYERLIKIQNGELLFTLHTSA